MDNSTLTLIYVLGMIVSFLVLKYFNKIKTDKDEVSLNYCLLSWFTAIPCIITLIFVKKTLNTIDDKIESDRFYEMNNKLYEIVRRITERIPNFEETLLYCFPGDIKGKLSELDMRINEILINLEAHFLSDSTLREMIGALRDIENIDHFINEVLQNNKLDTIEHKINNLNDIASYLEYSTKPYTATVAYYSDIEKTSNNKITNNMNKEEAKKFVENTKVYTQGKSKEIQEKLFELGFTWGSTWGNTDKGVSSTEYPFIYIYDIFISSGYNMIKFDNSNKKELTAYDILNIEIRTDREYTVGIDEVKPEYKYRDVLIRTDGTCPFVFKKMSEDRYPVALIGVNTLGKILEPDDDNIWTEDPVRYATEKEKDVFFKALINQGKYWNLEKKCVENISDKVDFSIDNFRKSRLEELSHFNKLADIILKPTNFKPFDYVLVDLSNKWHLYQISDYNENNIYFIGGVNFDTSSYSVIPYLGNEQLLGKRSSK
jgi:hypothetical protein